MAVGRTVMRQVPWAVGLSIVAHGVAIGGVLALDLGHDPPHALAVVPPRIELVPVAPAPAPPAEVIIPVDVGFVRLPDVAALPATATPASRATTVRRGTGGGIEPAPGADEGVGTAPGTPRSPYFELRRGERPQLRVDGTFQSFDPSAGPGPEVQIRTGQLQPDGTTQKSEQGVFTARVEGDGNVSLRDARNVHVRFAPPTPKHVGTAFTEWYQSDKGPDGQRGKRTLENDMAGSIDGPKPHLNDKGDRSKTVIIPVIRGGFDVTDGLMRAVGAGDPYASKKLAFLDATRDERVQAGAKYRAGQLAKTDLLVRENLARVWRTLADPGARKQAIFELWDEVVERGDPKVVDAGAAARRYIVGFVRARLPAGSAHAYTASELAALNRTRQSQQVFAPYE